MSVLSLCTLCTGSFLILISMEMKSDSKHIKVSKLKMCYVGCIVHTALGCKLQPFKCSFWIKTCGFKNKIMAFLPFIFTQPILLQFKNTVT